MPVTRKQKICLYRLGICPRITWDLTIFSYPLSWLQKTVDPLVTRYLKRWIGLAKSANTSRLCLPQTKGGLELQPVSVIYQKLQVGKAALLMTSRDAGVHYVQIATAERGTCSESQVLTSHHGSRNLLSCTKSHKEIPDKNG